MIESTIYIIGVSVYEVGYIKGLIDGAGGYTPPDASGLMGQLKVIKLDIDNDPGIVKKFLHNGILEISDVEGNRVTRAPYSTEIPLA